MQIPGLAVIVVVTALAAYFGFDAVHSGSREFWLIVGVPTVILAVVGVLRARRDDELREWLRPQWGDFTRGFLAAIALVVASHAFARIVTPPGSWRRIWLVSLYAQIGGPQTLQDHAFLVGVAILVLAAAEELLWRGLVTTLLAERFGSRTAWIWAAVLYAIAHLPTMWALRSLGGALNPVLPIAALAVGLVFGAMARKLQRLTPGILAHALFDWCVVMMFPLLTLPRAV
jgi:membrane protease YdiL (CAAX protease family)